MEAKLQAVQVQAVLWAAARAAAVLMAAAANGGAPRQPKVERPGRSGGFQARQVATVRCRRGLAETPDGAAGAMICSTKKSQSMHMKACTADSRRGHHSPRCQR